MFGKKGFDISMKFVIMWIILPLVAGVMIVLLVVAPTASALGSKGYSDSLCHLNVALKGKAWVGKVVIPLVMCKERAITVDADNWKACDPNSKNGWKDSGDIKRCAEQQLFNLMSRCWYMYGNTGDLGRGNDDSNICFGVKFRDLGDETITEDSLTNFMLEQKLPNGNNYCSVLQNNVPNGACGRVDEINWQISEIKDKESRRIWFHDNVWPSPGTDQIVIG